MARGRKPGFRMSDEHRVKIQNSNILNALIEHTEGKRDMSSSQVTAGLGLLRKVMPDMTEADIKHDVSDPLKEFLDEIAQIGRRVTDGDG